LEETYKELSYEKLKEIFIGGIIVDIAVNIAMYYYGYKALISH
jgi:hypothetical protein